MVMATFFGGSAMKAHTLVGRRSFLYSTTSELARSVLGGDRLALSRAITIAESSNPSHRQQAEQLLNEIVKNQRKRVAYRIGLSGTPGVGKSSFIERLGSYLTSQKLKVAVLAIDPSSAISGGSLLGDKSRMTNLARDPLAFVRPSPNRGIHGGVARATDEAASLCEAAGYDVVFVETVGVGQSESKVADTVDSFVLLVGPGAGDDLQASKKGILELADFVLVNKADGDLLASARAAFSDYHSSLLSMRQKLPFWRPPVLLLSCTAKEEKEGQKTSECRGLPEEELIYTPENVWPRLLAFQQLLVAKEVLIDRRVASRMVWAEKEAEEILKCKLETSPKVAAQRTAVQHLLRNQCISCRAAAHRLVDALFDFK